MSDSTPKGGKGGGGRGAGSGPQRAGNRHRGVQPIPKRAGASKGAPEEPRKGFTVKGDVGPNEPVKDPRKAPAAKDAPAGRIGTWAKANGITPLRVALNAVLLLALIFAAWYAFGTIQETLDRKAGVVATVDGVKITLEDLKKGDSTPALADVAAEDVLNLARQKAFEAYMDDEGVAKVTDEQFEEGLESYVGTMTLDAAAEQYAMTPGQLEKEIRFDLRMAEFRKDYTGVGDAPVAPEDSTDATAAAEYQSAMAAYTKATEDADSKWQDLLEEVFLHADVRLYTLGIGGY